MKWGLAQNYQSRLNPERPKWDKGGREIYLKWRATLPWTDEQFAEVYEKDADSVEAESPWLAEAYRYAADKCRRGFIGIKEVRHCLNALIKVCALCGKTALYRQGNSGRCRAHRMVLEIHAVRRRMRCEAKMSEREASRKFKDYLEAEKRSLKATGRATKQAFK